MTKTDNLKNGTIYTTPTVASLNPTKLPLSGRFLLFPRICLFLLKRLNRLVPEKLNDWFLNKALALPEVKAVVLSAQCQRALHRVLEEMKLGLR